MASAGTIRTTLKGISQKGAGSSFAQGKFIQIALDFNQPTNNVYCLDSNGTVWWFSVADQLWYDLSTTRGT
jgi:hypothetical protein